jgi:2-methylcitrate dehydratase PrpD
LINIAAGLALASSYNTINEGATVRNVFTGHSGVMGINAVDLTQAGFTGEADAAAMTYGTVLGESFSPEVALTGLGTEWMMAGSYFKLQPTARSVHPAIDAVEDALGKVPTGRIDASQVGAIAVRTYKSAAIKAQKDISTPFGAKFSIPFAVATRIVNGSATLDCFDDDDVANPAIQLLLRKVDVVEDPAMTEAWPASQPCDVEIRMKDGTLHPGRCVIVRGEPQRPNTLEEVRGKFVDLTVPVWGEKFALRIWNECMTIDDVDDVARWAEQFEL